MRPLPPGVHRAEAGHREDVRHEVHEQAAMLILHESMNLFCDLESTRFHHFSPLAAMASPEFASILISISLFLLLFSC